MANYFPYSDSINSVVATFTSDAARAEGGPGWLVERRLAAAEQLAARTLPTPDEEVWRYSPIGRLDLDRYARVSPGAASVTVPAPAQAVLDRYPQRAGAVVVHHGRVLVADASVPGLSIATATGHAGAQHLVGAALSEPADYFALLNDAYHHDAIVVTADSHAELSDPVVVVHFADAERSASLPRLVVEAAPGARVTVIEHVLSSDADLLVVPVTELIARRDSTLTYLNVQQLGAAAWQLASQVAWAESGATVAAANAAFGGHYARVRTDCTMAGRGARGELSSLYFGTGDQTLDFRIFQDHAERDTSSDLLFKGAVDDTAKAIYTGLIRVRKNAAGTNAFQTNRNLKLSDGAWAESVPNLEIHNNDVRCSHASTVGPIDEDQRFYLESRGVEPGVAERLIVAGFFAEVADRLPGAAAGLVRAAVAARLDRERAAR